MRHLAVFAFLFSLAMALAQVNEQTPGWFAFDVPGLEAPSGTPVDLSSLTTEPAGKSGFLRVVNGHFVDGRGERIRLIGSNITGDSCFMEPETADRLALRLRQWGFNCLRLHFMDFNRDTSIWADADTGKLNEDQLKRLDYLVAACAKNGIYINLNLHVGRAYPDQPKAGRSRLFRFGKTLDRWYEPYVVMIENYARGLLDRRNTVTGIRWADDPAIGAIEINNENTMIRELRAEYRQLPEPWRAAFLAKWNAWLKRKYGTTDALRKAWNRDVRPLGEEILDGPWIVQNGGEAESVLVQEGDVWRWTASKAGNASWNLQMQYKELRLPPGRYTFQFRARSRTKNRISHTLMLDTDPWGTVGLRAALDLSPEWQTSTITTPITEPSVDGPLRLNLSLGNKVGEAEFADFSLRPGGGNGLPPEQTLEKGIDIPADSVTDDVTNDWFAFLIDTEMATTKRLVSFLKKDLGCRAPISDTQVNYGGAGGIRRESELSDYIDIHGYWEHPSYTRNEKGWTTGFSMRNTTQVANASAGTLGNMAFHRVAGFPFTVSEYNTPAPNDHGAELFPLLAAMAALQDWDGLYTYTYRDFGKDYEDTRIRKYFHLIGRANLLVHIPAAVHLFRLGGLTPAPERTTVLLPGDRAAALARTSYSLGPLWSRRGAELGSAWFRRLELKVAKTGEPAILTPMSLPEGVRKGGAVNWHPQDGKGPWFSLNAPSVRLLVGHVGGRQFKLGDANVTVDKRPWPKELPAYACISLTALDRLPIAQSRRLLLAASARTENTNMVWNKDRTSLLGKEAWGGETTISEAVPLTLDLPGASFRATGLDALGKPGKPVQVNGNALRLRAENQTLWVLIER